MLDTNQIVQVFQDAATVHAQVSPYLPALAIAAGWAGRELRNFNAWLLGVSEFVISHGGLGMIILKLLWNPGVPPVATINPAIQQSTNPPAAS